MIIIIYIVALCIYMALPFPFQLILLIINFLVPDPIPVLDEVIMYASVINKLSFLDNVFSFFEDHEIIAMIVKCILVLLLLVLAYYFVHAVFATIF